MSRDGARTQWYRDSRFGMFIHWGLYAIPVRGEQVLGREEMTAEAYRRYYDTFCPTRYQPAEWAKLAKRAGMKYAVLTAKHHDGFCLFNSQFTDYTSMHAPRCRRDLVREYLEAFRAEGIRVGLYYSLLDWHHPDYPHFGDERHPARNDAAQGNERRDWNRYLDYMHGQIRELLTGYGKLDLMWFDFSYGDMAGEKWGASRIAEMIRQYQPEMLIDNRLEGSGTERGSIMTAHPKPYAGDFTSPEQMVPPEGYLNELGEPVPWESCLTLNDHWGYFAGDVHYKSVKLVIRSLVECVSKNGNMILNVGPDARGEIPAEARAVLEKVGAWMRDNGESIYGCGKADYPKPDWGRYTQRGDTLYAHVYEEAVSAFCLKDMGGRVCSLRRVADNAELQPARFWTLSGMEQHAFFFPCPGRLDGYPLPDDKDTVVAIELKEIENA